MNIQGLISAVEHVDEDCEQGMKTLSDSLEMVQFRSHKPQLDDQVTVTLDADTFERLKPGAARRIRHIVEEAVRSEVNIR